MEAIEFKTKIRNGTIQIPERYIKKIGDTVKVIIMTEERGKQADIIDNLLENPMKLKDFTPLSRERIYEGI